MTDVKKLLAEATPRPWRATTGDGQNPDNDPFRFPDSAVGEFLGWRLEPLEDPSRRHIRRGVDAALIAYAVNHLPDYEAAVDALHRFVGEWTASDYDDEASHVHRTMPLAHIREHVETMRDALTRLRGDQK